MFQFNGFLKDVSQLFRKDQTHWDGLHLENEIYSNFMFECINSYKTVRYEFFEKVNESLFEFGTPAAKTAFYTYLMFGEQYVNLLNPNFASNFFINLVKILFFIKKVDVCFEESENYNKEIIKCCINGMSYIEHDFKQHDGAYFLNHLKGLQITQHSENILKIERFFFDFVSEVNLQTFRLDLVDGKNEIVALNYQIFFPPVYVESIVIPRNHEDAHDVETISITDFMYMFLSDSKQDKVKRISKIIHSQTDVMLSSFARREIDNGDKRRMLH